MDYLDETYGMDCDNPENYPEYSHVSTAQDRRDYDNNGWYEVKNNPLSKEGVFPYKGSQIRTIDGETPPDPNKLYNVYRPAIELDNQETIDSFKLVPWVDNHAMLGKEEIGMTPAEKKGVSGVTGENIYFKDGTLYGNIKVFSETMAKRIESGKRELSLGYRCKYVKEKGTWNGQPYDYVQKEIRGNHLALVDDGRMGESVRVLDSSDENTGHFVFVCDSIVEKKEMTLEELKEKQAELDAAIAELEAKQVADEEPEQNENVGEIEDEAEEAGGEEGVLGKILDILESLSERIAKLEGEKTEDEAENHGAEDEDAENEEKGEEKNVAMDAADVAKNAAAIIDARNELYEKVKPFTGSFNCSAMDASDVASYACKKIGLKAEKGQEIAMLNGYLTNRTPDSKKKAVAVSAMDSSAADDGFINKQLSN